jgi:uncharacterized protein involved in type VI secretion and phage assembly
MSRFPGVVTATVSSIDDPAGEGRIEVRFPWMPGSPKSAWAPVASPLAGPSRGAFFSPEVDDEVLIAFEHGDFDFPYVIGYLWNGVDTPPESNRQNRVFVTPGGHKLRFEDGDPKKVVIGSAGGHEIVLNDDPSSNKIQISSSAGQTVTIDDVQQSVEIQGGGRILALKGGQVLIT